MRLYDNDEYREEFMELVYSLLQSDATNDRANLIIDAFDRAPAIEAEPLQPNNPLTLEELRKMDGEPVWIKWIKTVDDDRIYECECEWAIVSKKFERVAGNSTYFCFDKYGDVWIAYRRKPEEKST